ncbi:diacylglycerol kinase [bacterium BMS3Abin07]|nr:diacylglycerol kinase [bacterium BMS3Abin07]GBE32662.1 diacylglycerol kinase [bacterium BMS3Bbin05]HDO23319.1 diacylglycerol kinase family lipid kinase [Nitrospirota bacterium]HDZ88859.1 diacylglycerol kinase family lipid kinase [Nitrospirota bacterium]
MSSLAVLLVNPVAGSYKKDNVRLAEEILKRKGLITEVLLSKEKGEIEDLARSSIGMSPEMVFVLGGDGTFNEAVNGLVNTEIPVAFIPTGTTNVLARELDIPNNVSMAVERAVSSGVHKISLGRVSDYSKNVRYFVMMAGIGFDAATVCSVNRRLKGLLGKGAYILSGLKVLKNYEPEPIVVRSDDVESVGYSVIVGNGSYYGGGFRITPDASLFSPYFYVFVLKNEKRISLIRTFAGLLTSTHLNYQYVSYFRTQTLHLQGTSHIHVDGDYLGKLPVDITVERDCLNLLC